VHAKNRHSKYEIKVLYTKAALGKVKNNNNKKTRSCVFSKDSHGSPVACYVLEIMPYAYYVCFPMETGSWEGTAVHVMIVA